MSGLAPNARAAHSSSALESNQMVIYGGAVGGGSLATDDLYLMEYKDNRSTWFIVPVVGPTPGRRYGHSMVYMKPSLIVFGGNTGTDPANDVWIMAIDKSPFSWMKLDISGKQPFPRVYHSASFCNHGSASGMMVVFGGRNGEQVALNDAWGLRRHRDGRWDWTEAPSKLEPPIARYQHCCAFFGPLLIVVGGRSNQNDALSIDIYDTEISEWKKFLNLKRFRHSIFLLDINLYAFGGFDGSNTPTDLMSIINLKELCKGFPLLINKLTNEDAGEYQSAKTLPMDKHIKNSSFTPPKKQLTLKGDKEEKNVKISQVAIVGIDKPSSSLTKSVKVVPVATLQEEAKKKSYILVKDVAKMKSQKNESIAYKFIIELLKPKDWQTSKAEYFDFKKEEIYELATQFKAIVSQEPMILKVKAPVKVFGDIHGQYQDLMRFFDLWGSPYEDGGDIESYDYLFLGDYVDRGSHSLETICLLMALKVKYPKQIHMIRGNHEDRWINNAFGFADECSTRIGEDPNDPKSVFVCINDVFDWLPLAAVIDNKIICIHGGIGSTLNTISQISAIPRPLEVIHEVSNDAQQLVVDILWSDPTENDGEKGIQPNTIRDPNGTGNIVKFGPDKVMEFLKKNQLTMILRGHECVMDGFERFAGGALITVFSATDYCGRHKNAGAVIFITKTCELIPKLIYPLSNAENANWAQDENQQKRPPTPPRWVGHNFGKNESYD